MLRSLYPSLANLKLTSSKRDVCRPRASAYATAAVGRALTGDETALLAQNDQPICSICLESLLNPEDGTVQDGVRVACENAHTFHAQCLHAWIAYSSRGDEKCPTCREEIDSSEVQTVRGTRAPNAPKRPRTFVERRMRATEEEIQEDVDFAQRLRERAHELQQGDPQRAQFLTDADTFDNYARLSQVRNEIRAQRAGMSDAQLLQLTGSQLAEVMSSPTQKAHLEAAKRRQKAAENARQRREQASPRRGEGSSSGAATSDDVGQPPRSPPRSPSRLPSPPNSPVNQFSVTYSGPEGEE